MRAAFVRHPLPVGEPCCPLVGPNPWTLISLIVVNTHLSKPHLSKPCHPAPAGGNAVLLEEAGGNASHLYVDVVGE